MKTLFEKMRDNREARRAIAKLKEKQAYEEFATKQDESIRRQVAEANRKTLAIQDEAFWKPRHKGWLTQC